MTRILTALVLLPLAVWLALAAPHYVFVAALAAVGLGAFREFAGIAAAQNLANPGWLTAILGAVWLFLPGDLTLPGLAVIALIIMAIAMRRTSLAESLPYAAVSILGIVYIFGAWRMASALRDVNPHWLMLSLLVSWAGDTAAMYVGKSIGKHKLAPVVSPGKTWEGAIGSVAGGVIAALIYAHYLMPVIAPAAVALVAAVANIAGQIGDLAESAFKRGAGVKDSGASLPGHGGWLDRIDSSLFSVPATAALVLTWLAYSNY